MIKSMLRIAIAIAVALLVLWLLQSRIERRMVFVPSREWDADPWELGLEARELTFAAADETRLSGLWFESSEPQGVVVFAHGNAGNLSHRIPMAEVWRRELKLSVLLFDYRGYGRSQGVPDESGMLQDTLAAYDEAVRLGGEIPLVAGRSLGYGSGDPRGSGAGGPWPAPGFADGQCSAHGSQSITHSGNRPAGVHPARQCWQDRPGPVPGFDSARRTGPYHSH